ncbi:MAG: hypothetical protein QME62_10130 [Armatimonadota bacterium]|nr:hypothetical protein [Armatimonadota bacterium]
MTNLHKDFHGCFSYGLKFLESEFGFSEVEEYLRRIARNVYAPLIEALRTQELSALKEHWEKIMTIEEADFDLWFEDDVLVLQVRKCPALHHIRERGYEVYERFCETTRIINEEICRQAGYKATVQYNQEQGTCIQRFQKEK